MLEACADEVQAAVTKYKAESKRFKKELMKLKESESSLSADVDELTQALHDDVLTLLLTLFFCNINIWILILVSELCLVCIFVESYVYVIVGSLNSSL